MCRQNNKRHSDLKLLKKGQRRKKRNRIVQLNESHSKEKRFELLFKRINSLPHGETASPRVLKQVMETFRTQGPERVAWRTRNHYFKYVLRKACPLTALKVKTKILKWILHFTDSQCKEDKTCNVWPYCWFQLKSLLQHSVPTGDD